MFPRRVAAVLAAVTLCTIATHAQPPDSFSPARARTYAGTASSPLTGASGAAPPAIVAAFLRARGLAIADDALVAIGGGAIGGGLISIRFQQRSAGLRVYGVSVKAAFSGRGELVHLAENVAPSGAAGAPRASAAGALAAALARLHPDAGPPPAEARRSGATTVFERGAFFHAEPSVTRVVYPTADGSLRPGLLAETWSQRDNLLHETLVGADGEVVAVEARTARDSYNVFALDPSKSLQTVVAGPAPGGNESPAGWLAAASQRTTNITGNNTNAYLDTDNNNRADRGGDQVADGSFLAASDFGQQPSAADNRAVSVQNLFYLNNVVHDIAYRHGFTEAAGNFQADNFGRGGLGADPVKAEAQDGSGTNNANFATPADGTSGRMQMFLWSGVGPTHQVVVNAPSPATLDATGAEFGPALKPAGLTGDVVLVNDGVGTTSDGCEGAQAAVRGKIALVDRGTCAFTLKAINAASAGAKAVIIANNTGSTEIFTMGGTERVRIPAVMVGQNDGAALKASPSGLNVTLRHHPNPALMVDASLDADIVYHEFGHGLTWRMIGGMSGPMSGAIGEGMSDGLALLINGDDVIAEYLGQRPRRHPAESVRRLSPHLRRHGGAERPQRRRDLRGHHLAAAGTVPAERRAAADAERPGDRRHELHAGHAGLRGHARRHPAGGGDGRRHAHLPHLGGVRAVRRRRQRVWHDGGRPADDCRGLHPAGELPAVGAQASRDRINTAGCRARTPAKWLTWWRQDVPAATSTAPSASARAAGSSFRSPIALDTS